ncbi:T9SS type A sorting domain-containing protein, partial [Meridianimaribacter flavus]
TESQQFDYSIYNVQGQEVLKSSSVKTSIIDVTSLPTGIYILKLASNNETESFKIIKQ